MSSPAPTGTSSNVIVGFANLYVAPVGTAAPTVDTTGQIVTWPVAWVPSGFTEKGVTVNVDRKVSSIMVEEQSNPVGVYDESTEVTIDVILAEDTLANRLTAYGGGAIVATAPTGTTAGFSTLTLADALENYAVGFQAVNSFGLARIYIVPNMVSAGKVKTDYQRAKAPRTYPVTFTAVCALKDIIDIDYTAAATA